MGHRQRLLTLSAAALALGAPAAAYAIPITGLPGVEDIVGGVAGEVADFGVRALTSWVSDGAGWLVEQAFRALSAATDPRPGSEWFAASYQRMTVLAALVSAPCLVLGLAQAVIRQDTRMLGRVLAALPVAVLVSGAAVAVVQMLLGATDQVSLWLIQSAGDDVGEFGPAFAAGLLAAPGVSGFVLFLIACLAAIGALVLWLELLIRAALVYVLLGFLPVMAAIVIWPAAAGGLGRLVRLLVALILSKLVAVAVIAMGVAAVGAAGDGQGVEGVLVGTAMLAVACFAPLAVHRLLPLIEESVHVRGNLSAAGAARTAISVSYGIQSGQALLHQLRGRTAGPAPPMPGSHPSAPGGGGGSPPGSRPLPIAGGPR